MCAVSSIITRVVAPPLTYRCPDLGPRPLTHQGPGSVPRMGRSVYAEAATTDNLSSHTGGLMTKPGVEPASPSQRSMALPPNGMPR